MTRCTRVSTLTLPESCGSNLPSRSPASGLLLLGYAHSSSNAASSSNSFVLAACALFLNTGSTFLKCLWSVLRCLWSVCYRTDGEVSGQMPSLIIAAPPATNPFIVRCRYENVSSKSPDARGCVVSDLSSNTGGPAPDHKKERPMKIALLMLLLVATASPVLARPPRANRAVQ
jgi:hypothetical protein